MILTNNIIDELIGVEESYQSSYKLHDIIHNKEQREKLFNEFLSLENNLNYDWFTEYFQTEHSDRKQKMQDFTPNAIAEICNKLLGNANSNADICAGTGGLTIKRWNENKEALFYCEEFSDRALPFLLFNLAIRNIDGYVKHGDSLKNDFKTIYKLTKGQKFSDIDIVDSIDNLSADTVIMNPPYSMSWEQQKDTRFKYGIAPKSRADFAFLLHGFDKVNEHGKMAIILPHGVLFRSGAEKTIRESLIDNNYLDTVIGLPEKTFLHTAIPTVILLLKKKRDEKDILFIDAKEEFVKDRSINLIEKDNIDKIINTYNNRTFIDRLSNVIYINEIKDNDYNLNIPRYVDTFVEEKVIELEEVMKSLVEIEGQILHQKQGLATMLLDLVGTTEEDDKKIKEFANTFANIYGTRELEYKENKKLTTKTLKERQLTLFD